ncbi:unnamed protein product [Pleuronectes platessa]|uniref:Uncharacterized protein n=1 Tax=Pleuronectes platessa TaxID=8262 RepID=A0A9N7VR25_PLEPL|nr:unnamed protein product [Pleuronectes platessa]
MRLSVPLNCLLTVAATAGTLRVIEWKCCRAFVVQRPLEGLARRLSLELPFPRGGTVVLGSTGELFTVAPLILAIVSGLLMTDWATMEIKMETVCQCDMHANGKFTGPEVTTGAWRRNHKS